MPSNLSQILSSFPDLILIFISGIACLYCFLLNRRLTKLSNLETGLGATIVTLTKAIEGTYSAAQASQSSTIEAISKLDALLERSDRLTPQAELLVKALERSYERARDKQELLEHSIEVSLEGAVTKAEKTASSLLKIVAEIRNTELAHSSPPAQVAANEPQPNTVQLLPKTSVS